MLALERSRRYVAINVQAPGKQVVWCGHPLRCGVIGFCKWVRSDRGGGGLQGPHDYTITVVYKRSCTEKKTHRTMWLPLRLLLLLWSR